jgi:hypothetical protein
VLLTSSPKLFPTSVAIVCGHYPIRFAKIWNDVSFKTVSYISLFDDTHCVSSLEQKLSVFVVHKSQLGNSAVLTNIIVINIIIIIVILFQQQVWFVCYVSVSFPWSNHVSCASCVLINASMRIRISIYSGKILWQIYDVEYCSVLSLLSLLTFLKPTVFFMYHQM